MQVRMWKRYFVVTVAAYQLLTVERDDVARCGAILRMKSCAPCNGGYAHG